jgi:hypothetical protein
MALSSAYGAAKKEKMLQYFLVPDRLAFFLL